jgi:polyphenol oxidase
VDANPSDVPVLLEFDSFERFRRRVHTAVTTRTGGVSAPPFDSLNLGFRSGDDPKRVIENRRRALSLFHTGELLASYPLDSWVSLSQVHSANVVHVDANDAGKGSLSSEIGEAGGPVADADAMCTNVKGLTLVIMTADCLPVVIYDTVNHALGVAHCGWRPTVDGVIRNLIETMARDFGTKPDDIIAGIGPGIGFQNYEVGTEVAGQFTGEFYEGFRVIAEISSKDKNENDAAADESHVFFGTVRYDEEEFDGDPDGLYGRVFDPSIDVRDGVKYRLNLQAAVNAWLVNCGVPAGAISTIVRCTFAEPELFYSYRRDGARTGRMALLAELV